MDVAALSRLLPERAGTSFSIAVVQQCTGPEGMAGKPRGGNATGGEGKATRGEKRHTTGGKGTPT